MFTVRKHNDIWWPIILEDPDPDNPGEVREVTFKMKFRLLKRSDWNRLNEQVNALHKNDEKDRACEAAIVAHSLDWDDIEDENGKAIPFNKKNLKAVMDDPRAERAITLGLLRASSGLAARGNSQAG